MLFFDWPANGGGMFKAWEGGGGNGGGILLGVGGGMFGTEYGFVLNWDKVRCLIFKGDPFVGLFILSVLSSLLSSSSSDSESGGKEISSGFTVFTPEVS